MFQNQAQNQIRRHVPRWALIAVALLLLFGIGSAVRNAGWSQGYTQGLLTGSLVSSAGGSAEGSNLMPYLLAQNGYGLPGSLRGGHSFGVIGGLFHLLFFGFLIMLALRFFAFRRWHKHHGGHQGHHNGWGQGWQSGGHGSADQSEAGRPAPQPTSMPRQGGGPVNL